MIHAMTIQTLKETVLSVAGVTLPGVALQNGFRKRQFFGVQAQPLLVLCLQGISTDSAGFYGTETVADSLYDNTGTLADCTLTLTLYLPALHTAVGEEALEALCAALSVSEEGDFYKTTLSEMQFSEGLQCFTSTLTLHCRLLLLRQIKTVSIGRVEVTVRETKEGNG